MTKMTNPTNQETCPCEPLTCGCGGAGGCECGEDCACAEGSCECGASCDCGG